MLSRMILLGSLVGANFGEATLGIRGEGCGVVRGWVRTGERWGVVARGWDWRGNEGGRVGGWRCGDMGEKTLKFYPSFLAFWTDESGWGDFARGLEGE